MTCVIGLTGSIASGKSTVSLMFDDFNIPVIDADKLAREVVLPGEPAYNEIIETFGEDMLRKDRSIDRKKLGEVVFADKEKLEKLNKIVHPAIRQRMLEKRDAYIEAKEKCVVLDIPLLFENKLQHLVDRTVLVYVDESVQLERLMKRDNFTEIEAKQRINSQLPLKEKARLADAIINNNGSKHESFIQLEQLLTEWEII
ncbi:MAG TPA: dephospho-CoA kinase [Cerasibacillus sp.]|uniref:dephospho-CoA kinase n=1 Tax=Cerasibacillus sp. TaxID=2498711 RepID=UPI002F41E675